MSRREEIVEAVKGHLNDKTLITSDAIQKLVDFLNTPEFEHNDIHYALYRMSREYYVDEIRSPNFKNISEQGGAGEGEYAEGVWQIDDKYYRFTYNYYSYNGFEYDYGTLYVVEPKEKLITVYEAV